MTYYEENYEWEYTENADEDTYGYYRQYNAEYARLYKKCRAYMDRVLNIATLTEVGMEKAHPLLDLK